MTSVAALPADLPARRRLYRAGSGRALGGVAAGLAEHLGLSVFVLRLAFVALTLALKSAALFTGLRPTTSAYLPYSGTVTAWVSR